MLNFKIKTRLRRKRSEEAAAKSHKVNTFIHFAPLYFHNSAGFYLHGAAEETQPQLKMSAEKTTVWI